MKIVSVIGLWALIATSLPGQEAAKLPAGKEWLRKISQRTERGTLADASETVRGDSGKWNDEPKLQHLPPVQRKPPQQSLDDWADEAGDAGFQATPADDNWLVFRTRQLDDNDRVWVERVERRGNEFTIILNEAVWLGNYFKTFTYYQVIGVNLGKLAPGRYQAKWLIKPLDFTRFEDPGKPQDNWPKDERPAAQRKESELSVAFTVAAHR